MLLMLEFELGLLNAWIFTLYVVFFNLFPYVLSGKLIDRELVKKATAVDMQLNKSEKIVSNFISFLFFALIAYSFFLPLKLSTFWFYVGFLIYLFGAVIETLAMGSTSYRLIVVSAAPSVSEAIRAYRLGALDYINKAFGEASLLVTVANVLKKQPARQRQL